jgi:tRNA pseudouridine38-40 synthase
LGAKHRTKHGAGLRIKAEIEYDGTRFFGWQRQKSATSVQETIEKAVEAVFDGKESIQLYGAGRTDTGVHAACQVAHFDVRSDELARRWRGDCDKLAKAVNFYLAGSGAILLRTQEVSDDFHARFSASMRHYKYLICNRKTELALQKGRAWHVRASLDVEKMKTAATRLLGTHNFESFRSANCSAKNPTRTLSDISVCNENDLITIEVSSRSFLHNQVRIMVGTLKQIGEGKLQEDCIDHLLAVQDRTRAGETAPPYGLYLTGVDY